MGPSSEQEPDLGGKLLYAGELNQRGRALVSAGNIAGAASLSASADPTVQKLTIRDGIADFLVHSLDEALRILKNEIRKRNAVAVCVAGAPPTIEQEMLERGVKADLHRDELMARETGLSENLQFVSWRVDSSPARWLSKLDSIASECLRPVSGPDRRWLRLAPRYLGRTANGVRILSVDDEFVARFVEQVRQKASNGEIEVEVQIQIGGTGSNRQFRILPERSPG